MNVELLDVGRADLAEGPVWDDRSGLVLWVDIPNGIVHDYDLESGLHRLVTVPSVVGSLALRDDGCILAAAGADLRLLDEGRDHPVVASLPANDRRLRFNDGAIDPVGRFVVGTTSRSDLIPGASSLWSFDGARWREIRKAITISNGVAWAPNGDLIYVDTPTQRVDRFRYDRLSGTIGDVVSSLTIDPADGSPDGIALDEEGGVWVALWGGGAVHRYVEGRLAGRLLLPALLVTSLAFVGPGLDMLVITTARLTSNGQRDVDGDMGGSIFLTRPGVRGQRLPRLLSQPLSAEDS